MRDFLGDPRLVGRLGERAASGDLSHAYLITGPRAMGKHALARRIAETLVCERGRITGGCGECLACRKVEHGTHPDVREVGVLPERRDISIDQIRETARDLYLRPLESSWRVVIVDDAAELSEDAEDSLLKTLEEPPAHAVLILVARAPDAVAETLVSRCQPIPLRPVPTPRLREFVEARTGSAEIAALVAPLSGGRPGLALALAADEKARNERLALADELFALLGTGITARFGWARRTAEYQEGREEREEVRRALDERFALWLELVRDAALGPSLAPLHPERAERTALLASRVERARLGGLGDLLIRLRTDLARNSNFRAAAELLVLRLPYVPEFERTST